MAGMYPDNERLTLFGKDVIWPGVDDAGKFTNGSFTDPLIPPSYIPAQTINLLVDNLAQLISKLRGTPGNAASDQLAKVFSSAAIALTGMQRDAAGRAKVSAPVAADDIARKAEIDSHAEIKNPHGATSAATAARLVLRDSAGRAQFAAPAAAADVARKAEVDATNATLQTHTGNKTNPHAVTKAQVGLGLCGNTADAAKSVKNADTVDGKHVGTGADQLRTVLRPAMELPQAI